MTRSFHRIRGLLLRQLYLIKDSPTRLVQVFVWLTVDVVLWGYISQYLSGVVGGKVAFVSVLLGTVLLWNFLGQVMQGVTMPFFEDVWSRNFLNFFASPMSILDYVLGLVTASILRGVVALGVLLLLAYTLFGVSVLSLGGMLAAYILILFLFGIALGLIGTSIVLRLGPAAEWLVWPIPAIISPFVGVVYPIAILPGWMQIIGKALPPSYVFSGVRSILSGAGFKLNEFFIALALAAAYLLISYVIFRAVYYKSIKSGLLARYSAENVS